MGREETIGVPWSAVSPMERGRECAPGFDVAPPLPVPWRSLRLLRQVTVPWRRNRSYNELQIPLEHPGRHRESVLAVCNFLPALRVGDATDRRCGANLPVIAHVGNRKIGGHREIVRVFSRNRKIADRFPIWAEAPGLAACQTMEVRDRSHLQKCDV